jgi:hypothetical protein
MGGTNAQEPTVTRQLAVVLMSTVVIVGIIFVVKPRAAITDQASTIDITGLTQAAKVLPVEQFPGF